MSAILHAYNYFSCRIDGKLHEFGSLTDPNAVSITGNVKEFVKSVAVSTTQKLYDSSLDLATFQLALVACDFDVYLEQVADDNSTQGDEAFAQLLRGSGVAGKWGIPFIIPKQAAYSNFTKNFGGGTVDVIDIIRVRNISSSQAAVVLLMLFL